MSTLIVGAGAIGCMVAARLAASAQPAILVARPHTAPLLAQQGVQLIDADGAQLQSQIAVADSIAAGLRMAPDVDLIVLAVKAYHTAAVAEEIRQTHHTAPVLCLQNGLGNEETLAQALPQNPIVAGALTTPVTVLAPGRVQITRASYWLGLAPGPHASGIASVHQRFVQAGFRVQSWPHYQALKWSKLLMNLLANAQSAILGWSPAQIFAHPISARIEILAWREAIRTMQALGIRAVPLANYPLPLATRLVQVLPVGLARMLMRRFIVRGRGSKMPSLYYDLHPHPRRQSEVGWLNGAVADAARQTGIPAPVNHTLTRVLQDLLQARTDHKIWHDQPDTLWQTITAIPSF